MRKFPVLLSAFVWPGAGQWMQKRYPSAALFGFSFLIGFIVLMVFFVQILQVYYGQWLDFQGGSTTPDVPLSQFFITLGICFLVYFINLVDAWRAERPGRPRA